MGKLNLIELGRGIADLTEKELKERKEEFEGQKNYLHPLKMKTQRQQNALGKHNLKVLGKIIELRTLLREYVGDEKWE